MTKFLSDTTTTDTLNSQRVMCANFITTVKEFIFFLYIIVLIVARLCFSAKTKAPIRYRIYERDSTLSLPSPDRNLDVAVSESLTNDKQSGVSCPSISTLYSYDEDEGCRHTESTVKI
jgi:hypothetical protein